MKYFKIEAARTAKRYTIDPNVFLEITERKFPYEQKNEQGKLVQYGICPSCLNPIQLIGILKESEVKPYGKHTGKTIEGFPSWEQKNTKFLLNISKEVMSDLQ